MTESQVVARARRGEPGALRSLYEAHVDRIYRVAFRMTGDEELARDLTQDAFVRAFERLEDFREESAFSTWLHTIAVRLVLNRRRRRKWWQMRSRALASLDGGPTSPDGDRAAERGQLRRKVREAVDELPEIYRLVVVMHELEGYTHEEIARALDVAEGTSKARLSRARERLRERLAGVAEELFAGSGNSMNEGGAP